jgi:hypothetical protein
MTAALLHQSQLRELPAVTIASAEEVQKIVDHVVYIKGCAERVQVYTTAACYAAQCCTTQVYAIASDT